MLDGTTNSTAIFLPMAKLCGCHNLSMAQPCFCYAFAIGKTMAFFFFFSFFFTFSFKEEEKKDPVYWYVD